MSQSVVLDLPGVDPDVRELLTGLLSDDPKGFLDQREAADLQEIQEEGRERQAQYYDELRRQTLSYRLASLFRRYREQRSAA